MQLIDLSLVGTQVLGFLIMLWILRKYAWAPVLKALEDRREKIAGEFREAERRKAEADQLKANYEQELRGIETRARARLQEAVAEGQKVAGEMREHAMKDAQHRATLADEQITREREKSKELLKEQMISLSLRAAEKILRQKLDDPMQRKLVGEFIDEVGAAK